MISVEATPTATLTICSCCRLTRAAVKEQWKCVNASANCRRTVGATGQSISNSGHEKEPTVDGAGARTIIRRRSFDQANSHLITKIYIQIADHRWNTATTHCSLLQNQKPGPYSRPGSRSVTWRRPLAPYNNARLRVLQLVVPTTQKKKNHQSGTTDFGLFPIKAPDTRAPQRQSIRHKRMQMCELRRVRQ